MSETSQPFVLQAIHALQTGDRRSAATLIERELSAGEGSPHRMRSVSRLAAQIGEIEMSIEASRRAASSGSIEEALGYWGILASYGRSSEALTELQRQPSAVQNHPSVLHFRGTVSTVFGRFDEAQEVFRRALVQAPAALQTWFALAMIKTFSVGDADLLAMERLERQPGGDPEGRASLYYALGKAREECGDLDPAFEFYTKGAMLRRRQEPYDNERFRIATDEAIRDFTADSLSKLVPSGCAGQRSLFVTGLPRSGTTLTEQILLANSAVVDGGEVNLVKPALIPTLDFGWTGAISYQQRLRDADPWGKIGRDYGRFIDMRFQSPGLVVDKSLGQSHLVGLLLHALPDARIAWLRRSPEDIALSCFRTHFATGLGWTWSLTDIADHMRADDRLFNHWRSLFPDRILVVPYEELVHLPESWGRRLQEHFGLAVEPGVEKLPRHDRAVATASVSQVRQPISTSRIGQAAAFERQLKPFRERYYG